uniref:DNA-directed RNA polymerase omega chain n=1 Tax=Harveyella mirabilis TaxID=282355 RepID=A0A3S8UW34_9FLOR|nr:DNA-directed RNA polymerase omega chain [Harveyella mirabilis]
MNKYLKQTKIDLQYLIYKTEELLNIAKNRYKITIEVANRAKIKKKINKKNNSINKPIIQAILEMTTINKT